MTEHPAVAERPRPAPGRTPSSAPFWDGIEHGTLLVQRCDACGAPQFPPQASCGRCWGDSLTWEATDGRGRVVSSVVNHRLPSGARVDPYVTAVVELSPGVRLLAELVDGPDPVPVGLPVELAGPGTTCRFRPR